MPRMLRRRNRVGPMRASLTTAAVCTLAAAALIAMLMPGHWVPSAEASEAAPDSPPLAVVAAALKRVPGY